MRVYHVTPKRNGPSIALRGIDPSFSRGARPECWFVTAGLLPWAILHVMQKYKLGLGDVTALETLIPAKRLTRRRRGIYTCSEVVHGLYVVDSLDVSGVASSYPTGYAEKDGQAG